MHDNAAEGRHCMACGTGLPAEARFCWRCGTPVGSSSATPAVQWDTCTIVASDHQRGGGLLSWKTEFWAQAVGAKGIYNAGETGLVGGMAWHATKQQSAAVSGLVSRLTRDGWEPVGKGAEWWEHKFRRRR